MNDFDVYFEGEKNDEIRRIRKVTGYSEDHEKLEEYQKRVPFSLSRKLTSGISLA